MGSKATPTAVQAVLRSVSYANISENPSTSPRNISFVLTDGDGGTSTTVSKTINVTAINDAPTISLPGTNPTYTENDPAIFIDPNATVADFDSQDFDFGKLTVHFSNIATGDDRLLIQSNTVLLSLKRLILLLSTMLRQSVYQELTPRTLKMTLLSSLTLVQPS